MLARGLAHLRGNVVAYLALFVALSGTAVAATGLPANSVGTRQLQNRAVTGAKVARHTLTGANIKLSALGTVPNAARLGGESASSFQARVTGNCSGASAISQITATGSVVCQPAGTGTVTGVTAGAGLSGGGSAGDVSLSANPAAVQSRVTGQCLAGGALTSVNQDGTVACTDTPAHSEGHNGTAETVTPESLFSFGTVDDAAGVSASGDGTTFTVAAAGTYEVSITLIPQTNLAQSSTGLTIDNGGSLFVLPGAVANAPATTNRIVHLAAGDTVAVQNISVSSITLSALSTLQLIRLGP